MSGVSGLGCYADRLKNGNLPDGQRTMDKWFDTTAYVNPGPYSFGSGSRTEPNLRNPGAFGFDGTALSYYPGLEPEYNTLGALAPAERIQLLSDEWALVRAGAREIGPFLDLCAAFAGEDDHAVLEELVARHRDKIYARAYSMMRNEEEAIDLSQEAWVKGWQKLAQFQGDSSFATWMTRIVINLCLDQIRKQKRQRTESIEEMDEESGGVERQMPVVTVNPTAGLATWS